MKYSTCHICGLCPTPFKTLLKKVFGTLLTVLGFSAIVFLAWFVDIIILNDTGFLIIALLPVWISSLYFYTKLSLKYFLV